LLLDDELAALSYLRVLCSQIREVEVVKAFNDPVKFMETVAGLDFNLCILDIQMPGLDGLQVARQLDNKLVIFTTAHKEFAAEAFDLKAVDYVRKPLQKERFEQAMERARVQLGNPEPAEKLQYLWNTDKGKTLLGADTILYITSSDIDSRDKIAYLENGQRVTIKNTRFEQLLSVLPPVKFCRINKKEILALKMVRHFSAGKISTGPLVKGQDTEEFYLSEVYRAEFEKKIRDFGSN
jgi:two-component system, LytTR family, response regulator